MQYLQHKLIEDAVRRRQLAMHAADPGSPVHGPRLEEYEHHAHTAIAIAALRALRGDGDFLWLCEVLEQLVSEIAGARDAVEAERAMRRL